MDVDGKGTWFDPGDLDGSLHQLTDHLCLLVLVQLASLENDDRHVLLFANGLSYVGSNLFQKLGFQYDRGLPASALDLTGF